MFALPLFFFGSVIIVYLLCVGCICLLYSQEPLTQNQIKKHKRPEKKALARQRDNDRVASAQDQMRDAALLMKHAKEVTFNAHRHAQEFATNQINHSFQASLLSSPFF